MVIFSNGMGNVSAVTVTPGDTIYVNGSGRQIPITVTLGNMLKNQLKMLQEQ